MSCTSRPPINVTGKPTPIPNSKQQDNLPHHLPAYAGAVGPQCHSYTDFARAAPDKVGHQAVETDAGEEHRNQAKESRELGDDGLAPEERATCSSSVLMSVIGNRRSMA